MIILPNFNEGLSSNERKKLQKELEDLEVKISKSSFIDPSDMGRKKEIQSLLLSNGESDSYRFSTSKMKNPKRVTPFSRNRA